MTPDLIFERQRVEEVGQRQDVDGTRRRATYCRNIKKAVLMYAESSGRNSLLKIPGTHPCGCGLIFIINIFSVSDSKWVLYFRSEWYRVSRSHQESTQLAPTGERASF